MRFPYLGLKQNESQPRNRRDRKNIKALASEKTSNPRPTTTSVSTNKDDENGHCKPFKLDDDDDGENSFSFFQKFKEAYISITLFSQGSKI